MARSCLARAFLCLVSIAFAGAALAQPPTETDQPAPAAPPPVQRAPPGTTEPRAGRTTATNYAPQEPRLAVWAGFAESDNIARTELDPIDGSYQSIGLLAALGHNAPRISASVNSDVEFRTYSEDAIGNETVGTLNASAVFGLVQDRFSWRFDDNFGQGLTDAFAPIGPNNRQSFNVISSGPRLDLPVGARTDLALSGLYSSRRYDQSTNVDSDSIVYEFSAFRQATPTVRFGLVANTNNIDYTEFNAPSYRIDGFSLRYEKTLATGRVRAEGGKNEISSGNQKDDEPRFDFEWTRSLTARSNLSITAAREFTDSGALLGTNAAGSPIGTSSSDILVVPNPLEQKRLSVSYTVKMPKTNLSAGIGALNSDYVGNATVDNDQRTATVGLGHNISPRLTIGFNYYLADRDYTDTTRPKDKDTTASAWVSRTLGRKFSVALAISQYARRGSQHFDENRYEVRFGYSPTESATAAMQSVGR